MELTKKSASIDYLKAMAAILVVLHHAIVYPGADKTSMAWQAVLNLISSVHVPLFFAVAGYLCHKQDFKAYIRKKASRILVPFYLFTTLKLVYSLFISSEFAHAASLPEQLYDAYILGNLYWFPYAIMLSYCMAMLFWTEKEEPPTKWKQGVLPAATLCLLLINIPADLTAVKSLSLFQIGSTLFFFLFFLLGMLVRQYKKALSALLEAHKKGIFLVCLAFSCAVPWLLAQHMDLYSHRMKLAMALPGMLLLYLISKKMPAGISVLKLLGTYSLQIMFLDSFWKVVLFAVLGRFIGADSVLILLCTVLNLALSCVSCRIIERIPGVRFLFGL